MHSFLLQVNNLVDFFFNFINYLVNVVFYFFILKSKYMYFVIYKKFSSVFIFLLHIIQKMY